MRISDMPSVGKFAQSHSIRRDWVQVLAAISTAKTRGSDVTEHLKAVRAVLRAINAELKEIEAIDPTAFKLTQPEGNV